MLCCCCVFYLNALNKCLVSKEFPKDGECCNFVPMVELESTGNMRRKEDGRVGTENYLETPTCRGEIQRQ